MPTHRSKNSVDAYQLEDDETVVTHRGPVNGRKGQFVVNHLSTGVGENGGVVFSHDGTVRVLTEDEFNDEYGDYLDSPKPSEESSASGSAGKAKPSDLAK